MGPDEGRQEREQPQRRITKTEAKWIVAGILAILFGIFIAQNSRQVPVNFVFFDADVRLIWVFLLCGVLGGIIDRLLQRRGILWSPKERERERD